MADISMYNSQSYNQKKTNALLQSIYEAAKLTHTLAAVRQKTQQVQNAIYAQNLDVKWNVLQQYLNQYGIFINSLSDVFGIYVRKVDNEYRKHVTAGQLDEQLQTIIGFVYLKDCSADAANRCFKECLKKMLKERGLLSDYELSFL